MPTEAAPALCAFAGLADRILVREVVEAYFSAVSRKAWDELPGLFTAHCRWRTNREGVAVVHGRDAIVGTCAEVGRRYPLVVQMPHAIRVRIDGDSATATTLVHEMAKVDDAGGGFALAIYEDGLARTPDGWRFAERFFQGVYRQTVPMPEPLTT